MLKSAKRKEASDMTWFWVCGTDAAEDLEDLIYENQSQVNSER